MFLNCNIVRIKVFAGTTFCIAVSMTADFVEKSPSGHKF
jgi:hypothetical protein